MKMLVIIPMALSLLRLKALREQDAIDVDSYRILTLCSSFAMMGVLI